MRSVCGVRALNTRPGLLAAKDRVLAYVEAGGTLVVQYNTLPFGRGGAGRAAPTLAPYPLTPSRNRVTDGDGAGLFSVARSRPAAGPQQNHRR